uniref:Regucalcin n=1 Tax=Cuerna arida TaxID=1464854 RepID=A0A1B6FH44_9HEMI
MELNIEPVGSPTLLGEGPYWDEENQTLYYIDVVKPILFSFKPETGAHHSAEIETGGSNERVSFVIKIKDKKNKFVVAVKNRFTVVDWDGESPGPLTPQHLVDVESQDLCHLNDGKCDPSHRLWAGSLGHFPEGATGIDQVEKEQGSLYSMQKDKSVVKRRGKVNLSNGLAWSIDKKKFYYIDTVKYRIDSYDYDDATGDISNEKVAFCLKNNKVDGAPDGMTIDQEGMLWVACYNGYQVIRVDPNTGKLLQRLAIPSPNVTSVIFGGPNYEDLYVTTGTLQMTNEQIEKYPHSGCVFRVTGLGVKGTPSLPVVLQTDL